MLLKKKPQSGFAIKKTTRETNMPISVRNAVRVLLLNEDKLLLMCVEDFDISTIEGVRNKRFWCTIGGKIEEGESIERAAIREIFEETGIPKEAVELGPIVWFGEVDLMLKGTLTCMKETFIVAKTKQSDVFLHMPTSDEQEVVKKLVWFSLADIKNSNEIIFPILLPHYLPAIIEGKYPRQPIAIDLKINTY
jgi:8-oxo-dGTP pyrophosphatase MutT (NUDIX family)